MATLVLKYKSNHFLFNECYISRFFREKHYQPRVLLGLHAEKIGIVQITTYENLYDGWNFKACEMRETAVYSGVNEDFEHERNAEITPSDEFFYSIERLQTMGRWSEG
jgi:hypothetical protein